MEDSFFKELVANLAFIIKADHIFISRIPAGEAAEYVDTIAFWSGGKIIDNFRFNLEGTPCEQVIEGNIRFYPQDIQKFFPEAEKLVTLTAESYLGCPIFSQSGLVLGLISIFNPAQLENEQELTKIVQAFASLASSEFERSQTLEKLELSEARLQEVANCSRSIIWETDAEMKYTYISPIVEKISGYTPDEMIGTHHLDYVYEEDKAKFLEEVGQNLKAERIIDGFEYRAVDKQGGIHHISASGIAFYDDQGELVSCRGSSIDITESKLAEQALHDKESFNKRVLEYSLDAFIAISEKGKIIRWNAQAEEIFGWSEEDVSGKPLEKFIVPKGKKTAHRNGIKRVLETGESHILNQRIEIDAQHRDGHTFPVELTITPVYSDNKIISFSAFLRDVTEKKRQDALQQAELSILEMIAEYKPKAEVFEELCLAMEKQASTVAFASVLLVNKNTQSLELGAAPSFNIQVQQALDGLTIGECSGSCAAAVFRKSPVFVTNVQIDPLWAEFREFAKDHKIEACWSMPFYAENGDVLGSFALTHAIKAEPTESDIRVMKLAAHLAGITVERFNAHQALISSEQKFSKALEVSPDAVVITRVADGKIIEGNDACISLTGYTREELIGKTTLELNVYPPEERNRVVSLLQEKGKYDNFESILTRKDGVVLNTLSSGVILELNGELCIFAIVHDVTERKKVEDELKQSEEKLSTAFKTSPDAMLITTLDNGKCLDVNEGFVRLTGVSKEDAIGNRTVELGVWPNKSQRETFKKIIIDNGYVNNFDTEIKHSDGALIPVMLSANMIDIQGEQLIFTIAKDVSELKQSQFLLEESNWMLEIEKKALEQISLNIQPEQILKELIDSIEARYSDIYSSICLLDVEGQHLSCYVTSSRLPKEYEKDIGKLKIGPSVGSCGTAAYHNKNVFVSDIAVDPRWKDLKKMAGKYGLCACWSMPLLSVTGEVSGTIAIYYKEAKEADEKHIEVLERLRKIAEISIEQYRSKSELLHSEEKFRSAFGKAPIGVSLVDENGIIFQTNEMAYLASGYSEDEFCGKSIQEMTHPDDIERSMRMYQLLVSGEIENYELEKRYLSKAGEIVWAQLNVSSVRDANKNFLYAIAHNLDITERKKSEIDLYERTEEEAVFANLLKFSFLPLDEYMQLTLEEILSVSWIKVEDRGGIFLTKEQGDSKVLQLATTRRMSAELLTLCNNVDFGTCLCGQAALSKQIQFADCVDERHETRFEGMGPHGHYNVPIINDGKVLGVIVLYLADGHHSQKREVDFLARVADVLSLGLARKYAEEKVNYQAAHDSLTGLISRREFESRLQHVFSSSDSESEHALCYLDLDQFKVINDDGGHLAGDELLRQLASLLQSKVRKRDTLARLGGDEFGLLMEHCSIEEAMRVAENLRKAVEEFRFVWEKKNFSLGVSIGLVPIISGKSDVKGVLGAADAACYAAKDAGRNRIHIYNPEDVELAKRRGEMKWVTKIKEAIDEDRLRLYLQPIVPLFVKGKEKNKKHYECLIRMVDEDGNIVPPGAFLPAAERYDLSTRIDQWVFDSTYAWLEKRPGKNKGLTSCSVNLSGHSLSNDAFLNHILEKLEKGTVLPSSICFEITETVAISKLTNAIRFMEALKGKGCLFALDDFGSGVSSFGYLKNLPVDYLKIDGMFVRDMVDDPIDMEMVRSINEIGHVMGKKTIAEFVENKEILACLKKLGVDYAQGYHTGKPRAIKVPSLESQDKEEIVGESKPKHKRYRRTRKTD